MLTPQDIKEKTFAKAVFGGYDMASVDDFLEELCDDYANLFKESAILKSKIKVLVEKVEEYRSTEDAMRMALLTAQKMGDDIIDETKKKSEDMIKAADEEIAQKRENVSLEFADAEARLAAAREQTEKFIRASEEIMRQHAEFLSKLENLTHISGMKTIQEQAAEPAEEYAPEQEEEAPVEDAEDMDSTLKEIDQLVTNAIEEEAAEHEEEADAQQTRKFTEWNGDSDTPVSRPKFDFDNLKFGSNYFDD